MLWNDVDAEHLPSFCVSPPSSPEITGADNQTTNDDHGGLAVLAFQASQRGNIEPTLLHC